MSRLKIIFIFIIFLTITNSVFAQTSLTISATVNGDGSTPPPPPVEPVSSGGGGVGYVQAGSTVNFSGRAYPLSKVTIMKDFVPIVTTVAGQDAKFFVSVSSLDPGDYNFSVYGEDNNGRKSESISFPIIITSNITVDITGIFISPTIAVDKTDVIKGDNVTIFGQGIPESNVVISVHSNNEIFKTIPTDKNGIYLWVLDTSPLEIGEHLAKSKTVATDTASDYGKGVNFNVGEKGKIDSLICGSGKGDLNCDGTVDVIDYSIMAFWYKKPNPPAKIDLNHDGIVDLIDFSILAYYWNGN